MSLNQTHTSLWSLCRYNSIAVILDKGVLMKCKETGAKGEKFFDQKSHKPCQLVVPFGAAVCSRSKNLRRDQTLYSSFLIKFKGELAESLYYLTQLEDD